MSDHEIVEEHTLEIELRAQSLWPLAILGGFVGGLTVLGFFWLIATVVG